MQVKWELRVFVYCIHDNSTHTILKIKDIIIPYCFRIWMNGSIENEEIFKNIENCINVIFHYIQKVKGKEAIKENNSKDVRNSSETQIIL